MALISRSMSADEGFLRLGRAFRRISKLAGWLALAFLFSTAGPAWSAEGSFPRGPGFYFSIPKLLTLMIAFIVLDRRLLLG